MSTKVLIVEDDPLISEDLAMILRRAGYAIVGQAYNGTLALDMIKTRKPDIILLDIALGTSLSGLDIASIINDTFQLPFIFITSFSDKDTLHKAKNLLPQGYIVKPFKQKDILTTLEIVTHRVSIESEKTSIYSLEEINQNVNSPVTPKEYEILKDIAEGLRNEEIAARHFVTINTVKTHVKSIFAKLGISGRTQVAGKLFRSTK